jgi:hypothetical protein
MNWTPLICRGYKGAPMLTLTYRLKRRVTAGLLVALASCAVAAPPLVTAADAQVVAQQAGATYLKETANLHLVAHQGTKILHEEGQISGTLHGQLVVTITIGYTQATVSFTAHSSAGTLTGRGVESYYVSGKNGHFKGRMAVTGGTGNYSHTPGSSLQTTGLIKRAHYEVLMTVNGQLKL